jgi:hypothetical protein
MPHVRIEPQYELIKMHQADLRKGVERRQRADQARAIQRRRGSGHVGQALHDTLMALLPRWAEGLSALVRRIGRARAGEPLTAGATSPSVRRE